MDKKAHSVANGYENSTDYDYPEWRWWHNVLGLLIVLAIVIVISW
jgi:hypothetical protein